MSHDKNSSTRLWGRGGILEKDTNSSVHGWMIAPQYDAPSCNAGRFVNGYSQNPFLHSSVTSDCVTEDASRKFLAVDLLRILSLYNWESNNWLLIDFINYFHGRKKNAWRKDFSPCRLVIHRVTIILLVGSFSPIFQKNQLSVSIMQTSNFLNFSIASLHLFFSF